MCSLQRNYDVIRNWERFETGPLTVCLKFAPKWSFSYFQPILETIFVTIATLKCRINTRPLHFGYCSNKLRRNF